MAIRGTVILYNSSAQFAATNDTRQMLQSSGSSVGPNVVWFGGRTNLEITCRTYPPVAGNLQVQKLGADNFTWIQVGSGVLPVGITTAQVYSFDASPGTYRVFANSSGGMVGLYVTMAGIQYT